MSSMYVRPHLITDYLATLTLYLQISESNIYTLRQVWYTSLAFGGFSSDSKATVQQAHLMTEEMLRE
jgi:hypothetical protein